MSEKLDLNEIRQQIPLDLESQAFMRQAFERFLLSARAYHRIAKVARTIADLEDAADVRLGHLREALNLRCLDRASCGE